MIAFSLVASALVVPVSAQELPPPVRNFVPAKEYNPPPRVSPSYISDTSSFAPKKVTKPDSPDAHFSNYYGRPSRSGVVIPVVGELNPQKEGGVDLPVRTELPGPERLFRRDSEAQVYQRIIEENRKPGRAGKIPFPTYEPIAAQPYLPGERRLGWPQAVELVEPSYLCHDRLLFEQINFERHGWDLGIFQPLVSTGTFFANVVTMPYHLSKRPFERYECSAGKCLPGDATPMLLYPPEFSVTGLAGQAAAVTGVLWLFP